MRRYLPLILLLAFLAAFLVYAIVFLELHPA